jgi:UDP-glucose:(heptosyl)LPS alpha-1,3-glucosyltransferase
MPPDKRLTIVFVRRGYSQTGGAEAYLKRLARGVLDAGHNAQLITTSDWPQNEWPFGILHRLQCQSAIAFANELEQARPHIPCDVLISLERVWDCHVYRAGDGVHRAWLNRRQSFASPPQNFFHRFNRKHNDILRLEKSLLRDRRAGRVIVNSQMVNNEIVDLYGYPAEKIDIVRNGVPVSEFREAIANREQGRAALGLATDEIAVLFVGSGWERKGLRFAIKAIETCPDPKLRLFVAGCGNRRRYKSPRAHFLGTVVDLPRVYAAADIFVLPTIYDPFSNACLEALACGLPVITTRDNGFSEIIEDGVHGSIVDCANDLAGLRNAIRFWSDAARRAAVRSTNMQCAAQFDISGNVARTLEILVQAAASAASTSGKIRNT